MFDGLEGAGALVIALTAIAAPAVAAALIALAREGPTRLGAEVLAVVASVPALAAAAALPAGEVELAWLLLGTRLELDALGRALLALTGVVWLLAGVYALGYLERSRRRAEFFIAYALALTGTAGVTLAADIISFYGFFAVMTLASYPLVVHKRHRQAARAARVYIAMAIGGDLLLFAGVVAVVAELGAIDLALAPAAIADSERTGLISALLFFGFGVKAGALGLHMWLPLAYPAAPTPGSAILSGAIINIGLLGWLRLLPLGEASVGPLGVWAAASGIAAAYGAAIVGALQREPKAALAYSSVSQMGLVTAVVGVVLLRPDRAEAGMLAAGVFAIHHGLAKLTLFLGAGVARAAIGRTMRAVVTGGLLFATAAMVGVPLTSGGAAKKALKDAAPEGGGLGFELLHAALTLSPAATLLVLVGFLARLRAIPGSDRPAPASVQGAFVASALALAGAVLLAPGVGLGSLLQESLKPGEIVNALWPIAVGAIACAGAVVAARRRGSLPRVPPGDVLAWIEPAWHGGRDAVFAATGRAAEQVRSQLARLRDPLSRGRAAAIRSLHAEQALARFTTGILATLLLAILLVALIGAL